MRFVVGDAVLGEHGAVFVLKGAGAVVVFLIVDVSGEGGELGFADGEETVAALPGKGGEGFVLFFEPVVRGRFEFLHEIALREGSRQGQGEMHVIGHAAHAVGHATMSAGDLGEVGVESRTDGGSQPGFAVFGGEDEMHNDQGERLWFSVGPDDGSTLVLRS